MSKHSPDILRVDRSRGGGREIVNLNGEAIATTTCRMCADLIVRRFNSHDALLAACKAMIDELDRTGRVSESGVNVRSARAVIAAAEGGA